MTEDRDQLVHAALLARFANRQHDSSAHEAEGVVEVAGLLRDDAAESVAHELPEALIASAAHVIAAQQAYSSGGGSIESPEAVHAALEHMAEARKHIAKAEAIAQVIAVRHDLRGATQS
ncbi:hypothetical protein Ae168Ps1_2731 [Pseudonocardia sp. Ae168_Ps1]|uniref:hypothetical protein n=1 Tax=unclassified Pseudonocardia TaxID=2619320 RepID=UPI00094B44F4|nr:MULTISPECIES: hypothetical protein [unclassified Pseudonocardia]OLL74343.1 hypothetical protein Ae150APs1_2721 [Pseudonocardia sp. Ae150A_Ps1]OLL80325.1 hypothetical protein Ae168Ps1_2731 [Pseudonocardia sp. Ae168_Ps1]OLL85549.1 hypothetical protein Ae263Ps1_2604c [Pseudonocardia sp. Ae263_Ps1]OLL94423.1 hypothetical protein Ae356Ps1_4320 [Pseudonocardia sp. Ae356_Ps1]